MLLLLLLLLLLLRLLLLLLLQLGIDVQGLRDWTDKCRDNSSSNSTCSSDSSSSSSSELVAADVHDRGVYVHLEETADEAAQSSSINKTKIF